MASPGIILLDLLNRSAHVDPNLLLLNAPTPDYSEGLAGVDLALDGALTKYLIVSIIFVAAVVLTFRLCYLFMSHLRHMSCIQANRGQQIYWSLNPNLWLPWLKREVVYAPLGTKRHNREWQLSRASNHGTLPGRIHIVLLVLYAISNIIYCSILPYGQTDVAATVAELRGRAGVLSVVNMIPLTLFAGRNNPLIDILQISYDTFNLFHRWIGRICILEATVHTIAWYHNYLVFAPTDGPWQTSPGRIFLGAGFTAMSCMAIIFFPSLSPIRHAFYETFLHTHQVLAVVAFAGIHTHLDIESLPALHFIRITILIWITERTIRLWRILSLNIDFRTQSTTKCTIEALPGQACRITFRLPRHTTIRPGSHIYAYLPQFSLWMSHPFSIAWTNIESDPRIFAHVASTTSSEKSTRFRAYSAPPPTSLSLITAARTGLTRHIYNAASSATNQILHTTGFIEGPYAGHEDLASYGTVIMFAGGAGITHHLLQIRHLLSCAAARTVATRKIVLVWSVRDTETLAWVTPWIREILGMSEGAIMSVRVYVTRSALHSCEGIVAVVGRCCPGRVMDEVFQEGACGATFVSVCGPGAFADEVRAAVRERVGRRWIDMREESFTW